jgi:glutathione peroxidase
MKIFNPIIGTRWRGSAQRALAILLFGISAGAGAAPGQCPAFLDHDFQKLHTSDRVNLCTAFAGKPLLVVNTASHCGFTPQFSGLEAINQKYRDRGLVVIGFPSDDFNQEAKDQAETAQVCYENFGVTFTMLSPLPVKGAGANPVFRELARQKQEPRWNFNKYLVRPDGTVVAHFDSEVTPESPQFNAAVESLLAARTLRP